MSIPSLPFSQEEDTNLNVTPAGYGRSCTNCSRAKCRCVYRQSAEGQCERCHRLGKSCQQIATSRKRIAKKTTATTALPRTAGLEEKLHDLIAILRSSQQPASAVAAAAAAAAVASSSSSAVTPSADGQSPASEIVLPSLRHIQGPLAVLPPVGLGSLGDATTISSRSYASSSQSYAYPSPGASSTLSDNDRLPEPTASEAEAYLDRFRSWLEHWPFMRLDADVTSEALRRERPLLWLSIMNLTTTSVPQQQLLRERLRNEVSQRLVSECERNMDMLLAVLAHVGWAAFNSCISGKAFLVMFIQIAIGLAEEMGLTKFPNEMHYSTICFMTWCDQLQSSSMARTMEERRAVLSLWFLSSVYSSFIGKTETLVYTPYMQDCLEVLGREKDHPNDKTLVALVKLQLVGDEAHKLLARDRMSLDSRNDGSLVPMHVFKRGLLSQLHSLRQALDPSVASRYVVYSHSMSLEAQINTIGIFGEQKLPDAPRVESMYAALLAVKNWYEAFFKVPLETVAGMPLGNYVCMAQMQQLLYNLTVAEDPMWQRETVRETADLLAYLDRCISIFITAYAAHGFRHDGRDTGFFARFARMLRELRSLWDSAFSQRLEEIPTPMSQDVLGGGGRDEGRSDVAATPSSETHVEQGRSGRGDQERNQDFRSLRPVTVPTFPLPRSGDANP